MIERVKLKEFDRQMGGIIGIAKGVLWCLVITFFSVTLSEPMRKAVLHSYSGYYIAVLIHRAEPIIPPEISNVLGEYIKKLDEGLGHKDDGSDDQGHKHPDEIDRSPGESPPE